MILIDFLLTNLITTSVPSTSHCFSQQELCVLTLGIDPCSDTSFGSALIINQVVDLLTSCFVSCDLQEAAICWQGSLLPF